MLAVEFSNASTGVADPGTQDRARKAVKACKDKKDALRRYWPHFMVHTHDKKSREKILDGLNQYHGKKILELKASFLREVMKQKFFGAVSFSVICEVPGREGRGKENVLLTITEHAFYLRDVKTKREYFQVSTAMVRKWKPLVQTIMRFEILGEGKAVRVIEMEHPNVLLIVDHVTALMNFLKKAALDAKRDLQADRYHKNWGQSAGSGLGGPLTATDRARYPEVDGLGDKKGGVITRLEVPLPQKVDPYDPNQVVSIACAYEDYEQEFGQFWDLADDGYGFGMQDYDLKYDLIEGGRKTLADLLAGGATLQQVLEWLKANMANLGMFEPIRQLLVGGRDPVVSNSPLGQASSQLDGFNLLMHSELAPLDAYVGLNFLRSDLLGLAREEWKRFDWVTPAQCMGGDLPEVVKSVLGLLKNMTHPLATSLLECYADVSPESRPLLALNDSIADSLLMSCLAVARGLVDAGIHVKELQHILAAMPKVPAYDPILALYLAEALLPIVKELGTNDLLRDRFLSEPHTQKVDLGSIMRSIEELYNYTHFMNTPVALFFATHAPRFLDWVPGFPETLPEAREVFHVGRETALLLHNLDPKELGSLSSEIGDLAGAFYNVYLAYMQDPSLRPLAQDLFDRLTRAMRTAQTKVPAYQDLRKLLDPSSALQGVTIGLLDGTGDIATVAALLALEALDDRRRADLILSYGAELDKLLRTVYSLPTSAEQDRFTQVFRMFAMCTLGIAKPELAGKLRSKLAECGRGLLGIIRDEMSDPARRDKAQGLRCLLRPLASLSALGEGALVNFVTNDGNPAKMKSYELWFSLRAPEPNTHRLRQILGTLVQMKLTPAVLGRLGI